MCVSLSVSVCVSSVKGINVFITRVSRGLVHPSVSVVESLQS